MEIIVPELGESIVEATVARWLKKEGDPVSVGEPVVELETDKVDLEVGAKEDGVLAKIHHPEGADVKVGEVLGVIEAKAGNGRPQETGRPAESGQAAAPEQPAEAGEQPTAPAGQPQPAVPEPEKGMAASEQGDTRPTLIPNPSPYEGEGRRTGGAYKTGGAPAGGQAAEPAAQGGDGAVEERITPVARRFAEEQGVDLAQVKSSRPGERVTKEDVQRFLTEQPQPAAVEAPVEEQAAQIAAGQAPAPQAATAAAPKAETPPVQAATPAAAPAVQPETASGRRETRQRMSRRRRTIAARLVEAQQTAAMLTTFNDVDMGAIMDVRRRRQESFQKKYGIKLGFMSFFVKAVTGALKSFPMLNAEIQADEVVVKHYYDIGIAIGAEEGLVVPVLRDADRLSFSEIEKKIEEFIQKSKGGTLSLDDLRGGTFTITNGGVFGSLLSTPILNPPQVGILGMHRIEERPVAREGQVVIRPMMYLALSYDHRIVDGSEAVRFLVRVKELLEDPEELLLGG